MPTTRKPIWILSVLAVIGGFWGIAMVDKLGHGQEAYGMGLIAASLFVSACVCTAAVLASRPDRDA